MYITAPGRKGIHEIRRQLVTALGQTPMITCMRDEKETALSALGSKTQSPNVMRNTTIPSSVFEQAEQEVPEYPREGLGRVDH